MEAQSCVDRIQAQDTELADLARSHEDACHTSTEAGAHLAELQARQNELMQQLGQWRESVKEASPAFQHSLQCDAALLEEVQTWHLK